MLISESGGEFALLERLAQIIPVQNKQILKGIGDDAAVIRIEDQDEYLLVTTDTLVHGDHFNMSWSTPEQIGIKSVEVNVSDIAAMGGSPTFMFVSLVLTPETTIEWVEGLYRGIAESSRKHGVIVAGGDTTHGNSEVISITLLGSASPDELCLRSHAKPGDLLAVTGPLGASTAGLKMLQKNLPASDYLLAKHRTPECRLDVSRKIAKIVNAMIDISDGLASEVNHICDESSTGASVFEKDIPIHEDTISAGSILGENPIDFALRGGEDFELLFSIPPEKVETLNSAGIEYFIVGEITENDKRVLISKSHGEIELTGGYDHFG